MRSPSPNLKVSPPSTRQPIDYPQILPKVDTNLNRFLRYEVVEEPKQQSVSVEIEKNKTIQPTSPKLDPSPSKLGISPRKLPSKQSTEEINKIIQDARLVEEKTKILII